MGVITFWPDALALAHVTSISQRHNEARGLKNTNSTLSCNIGYANSSWAKVGLDVETISLLAITKSNGGYIYAGNPYKLFRSNTTNPSWEEIRNGLDLPSSNGSFGFYLSGFSTSYTLNSRIYAVATEPALCCGKIYKSDNGGLNWSKVFEITDAQSLKGAIYGIFEDPVNSSNIYAGSAKGILKSVDGGNTWSTISIPESLACPLCPFTLYAVTPTGIFFQYPVSNVTRSTDGGATWESVSGLPGGGQSVDQIVFAKAIPSTLYAVGGWKKGIFKSTDGGKNWTEITSPTLSASPKTIALSPNNPSVIFIGTNGAGVYQSDDSGNTWRQVNDGLDNLFINALEIDSSGQILYAGTNAGVYSILINNSPCTMTCLATAPSTALAGTDIQFSANGTLTNCIDAGGLFLWKKSPVWTGAKDGLKDSNNRIWFDSDFDDSSWATTILPDSGTDTVADDRFYRTHFNWDGSSNPVDLSFASDDGLTIYINGILLGEWGNGWRASGCVNRPEACTNNKLVSAQSIRSLLQKGDNVIAINVSNAGGGGDNNYYLTASLSCTGCASPITYEWNFGDGQTSTVQNPKHRYSNGNTYTWSLRTRYPGTSVCEKSGTINVTSFLVVDAPTSLSLNGKYYSPNPFEVSAKVTNLGQSTLSLVAVAIDLPSSLVLESSSSTISVSNLNPNEQRIVKWQVRALPQPNGSSPEYVVKAASANSFESVKKTIVLPPLYALSSVAFLPGFMGSRLYTPKDSGGKEASLWIPNSNGDMCTLRLNDNGSSTKEIYTRDIIDKVSVFSSFGGVYDDFIRYMNTLGGEKRFREWKAFPYDWRYDVRDIVANGIRMGENGQVTKTLELVAEMERLASESYTGKVTIITHSNGGLLAKALISELERRGKANRIDRLILVAAPQLGTPESIVRLLQGEGGPPYIRNSVFREAGENMPGAINLLPHQEYFNRVNNPVIEFDSSEKVRQVTSNLSSSISTYADFRTFLLGKGGTVIRQEPVLGDCDEATTDEQDRRPNIIHLNYLNKSKEFHDSYDNWSAPLGLQVTQIVGWGEQTVKGIKYTTKLVKRGKLSANALSYEPLKTDDGDGTVVLPSAASLSLAKTFYFDLPSYNRTFFGNIRHAEIMNSAPLHGFILQLLENNNAPSGEYFSTTKPSGSNGLTLRMQSPVEMHAYDSAGRHTGPIPNPDPSITQSSVEQQIPNSAYRRFGDDVYLYLDTQEKYRIELKGESLGTFSLSIEERMNDEMMGKSQFINFPTSAAMRGVLEVQHVADAPQLKLDIQGDGKDDFSIPSQTQYDGAMSLKVFKTTIQALSIPQNSKDSLSTKLDGAIAALERGDKKAMMTFLEVVMNDLRDPAFGIPSDLADNLSAIISAQLVASGECAIPIVNAHPTNLTANAGATVSFTASASSMPSASVQWQVCSSAGNACSDLSGATNNTLTLATTSAMNSNNYRAVFANTCGIANTEAATLSINPADLAITTTVNTPSAQISTNVSYTITVTNKGIGTATDVLIKDDLPASLTYISCSATGSGVCGGANNNRTITLPLMPANETVTITLMAKVNETALGGTVISNVAAVSGSTVDPDQSNNLATASFNATNPVPALSELSKTSAFKGDPGFVLTVTGANFVNGSVVRWNNTDRSTTFTSATQLKTVVLESDLAMEGTVNVTVVNPAPGGGQSATLMFTITSPVLGYEADVAPRPSGNNNGSVTVTDWVQLGRFIAGLDTPAIGSEFQRADCAPKTTLGDGKISITDWVQAGRYAAGLDSVVAAGGPTTPMSSILPELQPPQTEATRTLRAANASFPRGQIGSLAIQLDTQGNENAVAFSLNFDPARLIFLETKVGSDAGDASLQINTSQAAQGKIGLAMALPTGRTLAAGTRTLLNVRFIPAGGEDDSITGVSFGDQLLRRELADVNAVAVANISYTNALITLTGKAVATVSAADYNNGEQAAAAIVSAFGSQLAAYTQNAPGLPLPISLGGSQVIVKDSQGKEYFAPLFYASPTQINFQLPAGAAEGIATITVFSGAGGTTSGVLLVGKVAPAIFTADSTGKGVAAGSVLYVRPDGTRHEEPIARFDVIQNRFVPVPIELGTAGEQIYLTLYGTGIRNRSDLAKVKVQIGGVEAVVEYAGAQGYFAGLDQLNIKLPRSLAGRGLVNIEMQADGRLANSVTAYIK